MRYTEFNGLKYWLDETGYYRRNGLLLHREIWKFHNGKIPKGYHIHHIDKNKSNNDISNLQALSPSDHHKLHELSPEAKELSKKLCEAIRPLTKEWHASEEGRDWHRRHGLNTWANRLPIFMKCLVCGTEKFTKTYHQQFCSNACKSKWRRKSGLDDIEIYCEKCGIIFKRNKYAKGRFCSKKCSSNRSKN